MELHLFPSPRPQDELRRFLDGDLVFRADGAAAGDGSGSASAQDGDGGQSQADNDSGSGSAGDTDTSNDADTLSAEDARKLRNEAQNLRSRLRDAEKERDKLKNAGLTDAERRDKERDELNTNLTKAERRNRELLVELAAHELKFKRPKLAARLVDIEALDFTDEKALEQALKNLVKDAPELTGVAGAADAGEGRSRQLQPGGMNELLRKAAGR